MVVHKITSETARYSVCSLYLDGKFKVGSTNDYSVTCKFCLAGGRSAYYKNNSLPKGTARKKVNALEISPFITFRKAFNKFVAQVCWKDVIPFVFQCIRGLQPDNTGYTLKFWAKEENLHKKDE